MKTLNFSDLNIPTQLGRQVTIEYARCNKKIINNVKRIERVMKDAALASGATVVDSYFHCFDPQGISGVIVIAQSHFTVHAWPEYSYAAVDIFTCGSSIDISKAVNEMAKGFESDYNLISSDIKRGCPAPPPTDKCFNPDQHISIQFIKSAKKNEMMALYKDAGWWEEPLDADLSFLDAIVKDSFLFAGVFSGNRLIGMGRALSDGVSDAYIQDVVVLTAFRGKGLGKRLVQSIVKELKKRKIDWIGLIGEPNTGSFYEKLGFNLLKDYIPMKLNK